MLSLLGQPDFIQAGTKVVLAIFQASSGPRCSESAFYCSRMDQDLEALRCCYVLLIFVGYREHAMPYIKSASARRISNHEHQNPGPLENGYHLLYSNRSDV